MRKILALIRASWLEALSYRLRMLFSILGLLAAVLPFFFAARALQPVMAESIEGQGGQYFAFLVVGMITFAFMRTSITALPGTVSGSISTGTLEAMLGTPTPLRTLLTGLIGYSFIWTSIRCIVLLGFAWLMGAQVLWSRALLSSGILGLIVLVHLPFAVGTASMILAFRASGPVEGIVVWISTMLGGVYYPTSVIPDWLERVSAFVPLTYGLRALRRALLEPDISYSLLAADLLPLCVAGAVLAVLSLTAFWAALRYARHMGTLSQY